MRPIIKLKTPFKILWLTIEAIDVYKTLTSAPIANIIPNTTQGSIINVFF